MYGLGFPSLPNHGVQPGADTDAAFVVFIAAHGGSGLGQCVAHRGIPKPFCTVPTCEHCMVSIRAGDGSGSRNRHVASWMFCCACVGGHIAAQAQILHGDPEVSAAGCEAANHAWEVILTAQQLSGGRTGLAKLLGEVYSS